jgi:hypothetical protein
MSPGPSSPAKLIKTPIRANTLAYGVPFYQPIHFLKKSMNGKEGRRVSANIFRIVKKKFPIQYHSNDLLISVEHCSNSKQ